MRLTVKNKKVRQMMSVTIICLMIELLDELVGGVLAPAWPLIRHDLNLSYWQIGLLLTLPNVSSQLIEPILGIWADMGHRRQLIVGGGLVFAIALLILSISPTSVWLLIGFMLLVPGSSSFANVAQAMLMDLEPNRHEQAMARWTLAGSVGNVLGPLILAVSVSLGFGWRGALVSLALLIGLISLSLSGKPRVFKTVAHTKRPVHSFKQGIFNAISALKRPHVMRWLTLLQFSDLMLDGFRSFVALYLVDIVGATPIQASVAFTIWLGFGLLGDFLLIPLLTRVRGLTYLKISVMLVLFIYPAFLAVPSLSIKYILVGCLGFLNAGWYSILKGQLYTAMPGQSGAVITLNNLFGLVGGLTPLMLGFTALQIGLGNTMGLLIIAPLALLIGLLR